MTCSRGIERSLESNYAGSASAFFLALAGPSTTSIVRPSIIGACSITLTSERDLGDFLQVFQRDFRVVHFAPAELDGNPHLVTLEQPAAGVVHLETAMRFIGLRAQADLFDFNLGLRLLGFPILLRALEQELAKVEDAADGRHRSRGDFHQVEVGVAGHLDGLARGHNTDIFAVCADHADFSNADGFIYSEFVGAYTLLLEN